uniref:Uncharacterized protein n=1 Tax=Angiostrongylus cantonensis TaxID=6313 RepID=A0A0K0DPF5_ANGCA
MVSWENYAPSERVQSLPQVGLDIQTATFVIVGKLIVCLLGLLSFFSNFTILYTLDKRHKTSFSPENKGLIYLPAFVADVYSFYNDFPDGIFDNAEFVLVYNSVTSLGVHEWRKNVREVFPKSRYPFYFKYVECGHTVILLIVIAVLLVSQIYELVMLCTVESRIISELVT